ncbi:V-type proton ATPase subunit a, partial [Gryllus bimaculatus]
MPFPKHPPSIFRSEEMVLCQFFLQDEVAFACIEALGHMDAVQFQDVREVLKSLSTKIAEGFRAKLYRIPGETAAFDKALEEGKAQRRDLQKFTIQKLLFLVAVICIPWLLLAKPMVVFHQMAQ